MPQDEACIIQIIVNIGMETTTNEVILQYVGYFIPIWYSYQMSEFRVAHMLSNKALKPIFKWFTVPLFLSC